MQNDHLLERNLFGVPFREVITLAIWYTAFHGAIFLILDAVFWDDWVIYGVEREWIIVRFEQLGSMLNYVGYLHFLLIQFGVEIYKVLTFFMIFFQGMLLLLILREKVKLSDELSYVVVLLYLTTPLYIARVALIDFPYTLSVLFFFAGWFLIDKQKYLSLICFAMSFNTESLLVFYAIPILFQFLDGRSFHLSTVLEFVREYIGFLVLPFLWFGVKNLFFTPFGLYEGYNSGLDPKNIIISSSYQWADAHEFFGQFYESTSNQLSVLVLWLITYFFLCCSVKGLVFDLGRGLWLLSFGLLALLLGVIPYWLLGHVPTFFEWTSRHQLLMPLGMGFTMLGIVCLLAKRIQLFALSFILSVSFVINLNNYIDLRDDWKTQKELVEYLADSELIRNANVVIFDDKNRNALSRTYRFYELNGLVRKAFPEEDGKFAILKKHWASYLDGNYDLFFLPSYIAGGHERDLSKPIALVTLKKVDSINSFSIELFSEK